MVVTVKDVTLVVSLVLSLVSIILLFGISWFFQSSLNLLQYKVQFDRELLLKLQEQVNSQAVVGKNENNNTIPTPHDVKRQSGSDCQCKDGASGLVSLPGSEVLPDNQGLQGVKGDTGLNGIEKHGAVQMKGEKGNGPQRPIGLEGKQALVEQKRKQGDAGEIEGHGPAGRPGVLGAPNIKVAKGKKAVKGGKEERNGGTMYVRWGHDQCPSTAQLLYKGRTGEVDFKQGGVISLQCLPLDPKFPTEISGNQQYRFLMYGAEYNAHTDSNSQLHGTHVPCAVCYVSQRSTVYILPAKNLCPSGWTREYYGYLMSNYYEYPPPHYICVDYALKSITGSEANVKGVYLGRCGSLPCPPYDNTRELLCAVCTQ